MTKMNLKITQKIISQMKCLKKKSNRHYLMVFQLSFPFLALLQINNSWGKIKNIQEKKTFIIMKYLGAI